ncbi:MAG: tyrosine-protein phosphatase [Planctomycetia bacterium]|nr:tyrosine-protein phosphatase [Planctomycetia bacterium]
MSLTSQTDGANCIRKRVIYVLRTTVCLAVFFGIIEVVRLSLGPNWHTIVDGELYRSAHLSSQEIQTAVDRFGIRSIINLRNCCPWEPWYQDETSAVEALNLHRVDFNFSAYLPPAPDQLQKLWQTLETAPRPILIHCRRGADRTGLASVIAYLHHQGDGPVEPALRQLSILRGHVPIDRVLEMDKVVNYYIDWLAQTGQSHTRNALKHWIFEEYRPGQCWGEVIPIQVPDRIAAGEHQVIKVKLHNQSQYPWHFDRGSNVGVHLRGYIEPEWAKPPPWIKADDPLPHRKYLAAGFMGVVVQPQQTIELTVAIPPLREPGKYRLFLDMYDEQLRCYGDMVGSKALKKKLEIVSASVAQR